MEGGFTSFAKQMSGFMVVPQFQSVLVENSYLSQQLPSLLIFLGRMTFKDGFVSWPIRKLVEQLSYANLAEAQRGYNLGVCAQDPDGRWLGCDTIYMWIIEVYILFRVWAMRLVLCGIVILMAIVTKL